MLNNSLVDFPSPSSISYLWNFGSLLGICLMTQIITGLFLAMHYTADVNLAFTSIIHINKDVNYGWLLHYSHMNGASLFFICLYIHISRGIYYSSYKLKETWNVGVIILLLTMMTAFIGYVLPWGQMSYWGASVITNLVSAIPFLGSTLVQWVWGGFTVENPTLTRFFSLHFVMPFAILALAVIHLIFLHQTGSNNPTGSKMTIDKIPFHPFFTMKDSITALILVSMLLIISSLFPFTLGDPENFNPSNPLVTPIHIQPEWYFLFAYAILRSIPNKLGGVIALAASILILMVLPLSQSFFIKSSLYLPSVKILFWAFTATAVVLTWIGKNPVEPPFIMIGQVFSLYYFLSFMLTPLMTKSI